MPSTRPRHLAFTLIELLVVIGIIVVLVAITGPVITSMKSSGDVSKTIYDVAGILEQSRAYAMSNNTYVYVGFAEVDVSLAATGKQKTGIGRLGIAVVATRDGTQGNVQGWTTNYKNFKSNLNTIGKPTVFNNVHVPDLQDPPTSGGMVRPAVKDIDGVSYRLGSTDCKSATPFDYPTDKDIDAGNYSFKKVIQYDPQGVARIQSSNNPSLIVPYIEIGLQQSRGTVFSPVPNQATSGNIAAIQIDGITGAVRIYRP